MSAPATEAQALPTVEGGDDVLDAARDVIRALVALAEPIDRAVVEPAYARDVEWFAARGVRALDAFAIKLAGAAGPAEDALYDALSDVAAVAALAGILAGRWSHAVSREDAQRAILWIVNRLSETWIEADPRKRWAAELARTE